MRRQFVRLALSVFFISAPGSPATRNEVAVAAAAGLTKVFQTLGPVFEAATGIHPVFTFGSTAQLTQQIESGAPWDVFASADREHIGELDRKGLLAPGSRAVYATGILALWIPPGAPARAARIEDLTGSAFRVIALANPDLAPYGLAAREALQRSGIWDKVQPRVVYAGNAAMARQYGATGNADAVFTAYSLVSRENGVVIPVAEALHRPVTQELGIMAASKNRAAARSFAEFLVTGKGRQLLLSAGYR